MTPKPSSLARANAFAEMERRETSSGIEGEVPARADGPLVDVLGWTSWPATGSSRRDD